MRRMRTCGLKGTFSGAVGAFGVSTRSVPLAGVSGRGQVARTSPGLHVVGLLLLWSHGGRILEGPFQRKEKANFWCSLFFLLTEEVFF